MNFAIDTICKYNYCGYKTRKEPSKEIQIIYFDKYFEKEYDGAKSTEETVMRKILVLGHVIMARQCLFVRSTVCFTTGSVSAMKQV